MNPVVTDPSTRVVRRAKLRDPVLVPAGAVGAVLLSVLGLGIAVGWMAARGFAAPPAAPSPAVTVERVCPTPAAATAAHATAPAEIAPRAPSLAHAQATPPAPASAPIAASTLAPPSDPPPRAKIATPAAPPLEPASVAASVRHARVARIAERANTPGYSWEPARM
jgi:hypothetical protein